MSYRMQRIACFALFAALLVVAGAQPVNAQDDVPAAASADAAALPRTLRVGVYASPPFVMKKGDQYTGMAIDLWTSLAARLGVRSEYVELDSPGHLVDAAANGDVDIGVTNLTVTRNRARRVDFSYPWFDGGIRIMVSDKGGSGFRGLLTGLRESGHLRAYAWIALIIVVATVLMTVFDRRFDKDFPRTWRDGIAESFYSVMSIATSGKTPSRKNLFGWIGRIWQGLWLVCGIAVLAYVTSSVTSVMTTLALTGRINSVADLPGHTIGVRTGSTTEEYAREAGLTARAYRNLDEAVEGLLGGEVDALIDDAPVLEYFAYSNPDKHVTVTGAIFEPDKNAFAFPLRSPLRRPVSVELIALHRSGLIEDLRTKYFGVRE
jgi:polar amino acid transport system substrate-binding protein